MDAGECTTVEELLALAVDRKGWAERVRQIDPVDHNIAATMATSSLDTNAEEWKKGAEVYVAEKGDDDESPFIHDSIQKLFTPWCMYAYSQPPEKG